MTEMSCDDISGGMDFSMDVEELARIIRGHGFKNQMANAAAKPQETGIPSMVFERDGKRYIITFPKPGPGSQSEADSCNPYSMNDLIERGKHAPLIDLYKERIQRSKETLAETDVQTNPDSLIDLYSERILKRRR